MFGAVFLNQSGIRWWNSKSLSHCDCLTARRHIIWWPSYTYFNLQYSWFFLLL